MNKNIIVISHRRSGTHLTIDTIRNNFKRYKKHHFFTLNEDILQEENQKEFFRLCKTNSVVIKTHFLPNFNIYSLPKNLVKQIQEVFDNSHLIYVYRNGLDVMVSLYEYMKKFDTSVQQMDFNNFIFTKNNFDKTEKEYNRFEFWKQHITSWKSSSYKKIHYIKYEDFLKNYEVSINKIAEIFNIEKSTNIVDIRLQNISHKGVVNKILNRLKGIQKTSVSARKGSIGDYKNYFSEESLKAFFIENKEFMESLEYVL